jgi:hypothetical protein
MLARGPMNKASAHGAGACRFEPFKSSVEDKRGAGSASSNLKLKYGVSSYPVHPPLVFALRFDITASRYAPICCAVGDDVPGYFAVSFRPASGSESSHCFFLCSRVTVFRTSVGLRFCFVAMFSRCRRRLNLAATHGFFMRRRVSQRVLAVAAQRWASRSRILAALRLLPLCSKKVSYTEQFASCQIPPRQHPANINYSR